MTAISPAEAAKELVTWLDAQGRLVQWPSKYKAQRVAAAYFVAKFERGRRYSESEVNEVFDRWTLFRDAAILRRTMVEEHLLDRTADGSQYWLADE